MSHESFSSFPPPDPATINDDVPIPYIPTVRLPPMPPTSARARLANALRAFAADVEAGLIDATDQAILTMTVRVLGAPCASDDESATYAQEKADAQEKDDDVWPTGEIGAW